MFLDIIHTSLDNPSFFSAAPIDPENPGQVPRNLWAGPTHFTQGSYCYNLERFVWTNVLLPGKASPWKCTHGDFSLALPPAPWTARDYLLTTKVQNQEQVRTMTSLIWGQSNISNKMKRNSAQWYTWWKNSMKYENLGGQRNILWDFSSI